jgi:hypothetical protein
LLAEQGIDTPSSVDPDIDSVLIEKLSYLDHVTRRHFRIVFSHWALWVFVTVAVID